MGRYTDPKIILDKRFEAVSKGLETLYTNIGNNVKAIQARAQKKKALQDNIIKDYGKMYLKNTQESYNKALNWADSNKNAFEKDNTFVTDIQSIYKGGLDDIVDFIQTGASESDILALVNERSNDANKLTKGIVGFSNLSATNNDGLKNIAAQTGKIKGNKTGDVVIGSDNAGIFAATGTQVGEEIPFSELRVVGSLKKGVSLFYDRDGNKEADKRREITTDEGDVVEVQESEILDLFKLGENYESGNTDAYFGTVEDITEIVKENSTQLKNLGKDGAFTKEVVYVGENGQNQKAVYIDEKKRQDYFLDESTAGGKLINNIIASKDLTMLAQLVGGYKFANKADFANNPGEMELLKVGLIDKLIPSLFPGSQKLAPASFGDKISKSITVGNVDPDIATLEEWAKPTHDDVIAFRQNTDNIDVLKKYLGASFKEGTGSLSGGKITAIEYADPSGANNKIKVTYQPTGSQAVTKVYDMLEDEGALSGRQFEANIMLGTFPNAKPTKVQGVIGGLISGEPYKGDQETSTRTTTKKGISVMSQDEFNAMRSGSEDVLKFDNLYDQWHNGIYGNQNPVQASAVQNNQQTNNVFQVSEMKKARDNKDAPENTTDVKYSELSETSFGGGDYSSNTRVGDVAVYKNDGSLDDQYRKIINFETIGGSVNGEGVTNYGFTDTITYPNTPKSPEEAVKYIKTAVVPKVEKDLGFKIDEIKSDPETIASIVDYKMNTGRGISDLLVIAYENQMNLADDKRTWDGIKGAGIGSAKVTDEMKKALKEGKITPAAIAAAKDELYVGRIQYMKEQLAKDPKDRDPNFKGTKAKYDEAVKAYRKSHSNRVKIFA